MACSGTAFFLTFLAMNTYIHIYILLRVATVLVELWPPHIHILYVRFRDRKFLQNGVVNPTPNPNLEDQGISLSLVPPLKPVQHGWPYQQLCCRRHSVRVHWCTQAPSHSNRVLLTRWRHHRGGPHLYLELATSNANGWHVAVSTAQKILNTSVLNGCKSMSRLPDLNVCIFLLVFCHTTDSHLWRTGLKHPIST
jgi:hypothetical protein